MTLAEACLKLAEELPVSLLESLILQLRNGQLPKVPNPHYQSRVDAVWNSWRDQAGEMLAMLDVLILSKQRSTTWELVWTGPSTPLVPTRRTEQVILDLIRGTQVRFSVTSFGIFQITRMVQELALLLDRGADLRIVVGDRESGTADNLDRHVRQLGDRVISQATILHWPAGRRSRNDQGHAGLMHAKVAVADSHTAFLTSANLTEAAFELNMELGVLVRGGVLPAKIDQLLDFLVESGDLQRLSV